MHRIIVVSPQGILEKELNDELLASKGPMRTLSQSVSIIVKNF